MSLKTFSISQELISKIKAVSVATDIPMSRLISKALEKLFNEMDSDEVIRKYVAEQKKLNKKGAA